MSDIKKLKDSNGVTAFFKDEAARNRITVIEGKEAGWDAKSNFDGNYNSLTNKPTIPTVPTNVSSFTNDAGYLTQHQQLKTINSQSIVGTGNIVIQGGGGGSTAWSDITGKPDAFPPSAHEHTVSEITDFPSIPTDTLELTNGAGFITADYHDATKQNTIEDLATIRSGASAGATALQSFTETDPTVPSWAKQSSKPTYTASEVGARPNTWMPSAADVGALPDTTVIPAAVTDDHINSLIDAKLGVIENGSY